jgi:hypothetical protein
VHSRAFGLVGGYQQLAGASVGQAVRPAVRAGGLDAGPAETRLEAARLIVNAGVDNAAVSAALVAGRRVFLFQQDDPGGRALFAQFPGGGGADDAGADNDGVVCQLRLQDAEPFSIGNA